MKVCISVIEAVNLQLISTNNSFLQEIFCRIKVQGDSIKTKNGTIISPSSHEQTNISWNFSFILYLKVLFLLKSHKIFKKSEINELDQTSESGVPIFIDLVAKKNWSSEVIGGVTICLLLEKIKKETIENWYSLFPKNSRSLEEQQTSKLLGFSQIRIKFERVLEHEDVEKQIFQLTEKISKICQQPIPTNVVGNPNVNQSSKLPTSKKEEIMEEEEKDLEEVETNSTLDPYDDKLVQSSNNNIHLLRDSGNEFTDFSELKDIDSIADFNTRFQTVTEIIHSFNSNTSTKVKSKAYVDLLHLYQDFLFSARTYGKIIISEVYLPDNEKTIKPVQIGGIAGGQKFCCRNILFKFALDFHNIYGSDEAAMKVAGHELKSLTRFYNCFVPGLCLPLCCLVDYKGLRLVCESILPIDNSTIVSGSNDSGKTIHSATPELVTKLEKVSAILNIKPHKCGKNEILVYCGGADVEAHKGKDGRIYVVDLARLFPPEPPKNSLRGSHLFCLFRSEFCRFYPHPLCSDSFSGFLTPSQVEENNDEIRVAYHFLISQVIPNFINNQLLSYIEEAQRKQEFDPIIITTLAHSCGINIRHFGLIITHLSNSLEEAKNKISIQNCVILIMIEMAARSIKCLLRKRLRDHMRILQHPLEEPYIRVTREFLNVVFGSSEKSSIFWNSKLKNHIEQKFLFSVDSILNLCGNSSFKQFLSHFIGLSSTSSSSQITDGRIIILQRLEKMIGLKIKSSVLKQIKANSHLLDKMKTIFDEQDLKELGERIKTMDIVAQAEGFLLKCKGIEEGSPRHLKMAIKVLEASLISTPLSKVTLRNCAEAIFRLEIQEQTNQKLASIRSQQGETKQLSSNPIHLSLYNPRIEKANQYFLRSIEADPTDPESLFAYAHFLTRCNESKKALYYHVKALEYDSTHLACLISLSQLFQRMGYPSNHATILQIQQRISLLKANSNFNT